MAQRTAKARATLKKADERADTLLDKVKASPYTPLVLILTHAVAFIAGGLLF